jgi:hypothetical protein
MGNCVYVLFRFITKRPSCASAIIAGQWRGVRGDSYSLFRPTWRVDFTSWQHMFCGYKIQVESRKRALELKSQRSWLFRTLQCLPKYSNYTE